MLRAARKKIWFCGNNKDKARARENRRDKAGKTQAKEKSSVLDEGDVSGLDIIDLTKDEIWAFCMKGWQFIILGLIDSVVQRVTEKDLLIGFAK